MKKKIIGKKYIQIQYLKNFCVNGKCSEPITDWEYDEYARRL